MLRVVILAVVGTMGGVLARFTCDATRAQLNVPPPKSNFNHPPLRPLPRHAALATLLYNLQLLATQCLIPASQPGWWAVWHTSLPRSSPCSRRTRSSPSPPYSPSTSAPTPLSPARPLPSEIGR